MGESDSNRCVNLPRFFFVPIRLAASEVREDIQQVLDGDGPYHWRGVSSSPQTGNFLVRFSVNNLYYLSNQRVPLTAFLNRGALARAFTPEMVITPGGRVGIEAQNTIAEQLTAGVLLIGVKQMVIPE